MIPSVLARSVKHITDALGPTGLDDLMEDLSNPKLTNWTIAERFDLGILRVRVLRENFDGLYSAWRKQQRASKQRPARPRLRLLKQSA